MTRADKRVPETPDKVSVHSKVLEPAQRAQEMDEQRTVEPDVYFVENFVDDGRSLDPGSFYCKEDKIFKVSTNQVQLDLQITCDPMSKTRLGVHFSVLSDGYGGDMFLQSGGLAYLVRANPSNIL